MTRGYIDDNDASRLELNELVSRLDGQAFDFKVGAGWTVSTVLCHLAFWDRRILSLIRQWESDHFEPYRLSAQSIDSINNAVREISRAVPGSASARLALESAAAVDSKVAALNDELIDQIVAGGFERVLKRSLHRREHLRKLTEALEQSSGSSG